MSWVLSDHACRHCHGRIMASEDGTTYRCAQCGAVPGWPEKSPCHDRPYGDIKDLCACGVRVGVRQVLECVVLPEPRDVGWPEVAVRSRDVELAPPSVRPRVVSGD